MVQESWIKDIPSAELVRSLEVRPILEEERPRWDNLMRERHYLGFRVLAGRSMRYIAVFQDQWLALLGWSAAALRCKARDQWIGWLSSLRVQRLEFLANNSRFLILSPSIPNLASRVLSLNLKRLSRDWQEVYGHPIRLVETFVDPRYFQGTCYKAAGWTFVGYTRGFAKRARFYAEHGHPKMVFLRPLCATAKKQLHAPYLKIKTLKEAKPMKISEKHADDLIDRLSKIPDPRMPRGMRHRKLSILAIAICAVMSNARSFCAIAEWAKRCPQDMLKRLRCRYDEKTRQYIPPSEPTIRRFLQKVDPTPVDQALCGWINSLSQNSSAIAVDGKTLKGARQENGPVHLLSAFLHEQKTVLTQCPVESKTNEITTVAPLLAPFDIKGRVVTFDAMHAQKETARFLVEDKQADYLVTVKDNQRTLKNDIEDLRMIDFPPSAPNARQGTRQDRSPASLDQR